MSAAKRDNSRFSFLFKLRCDPNQAIEASAKLPGAVMTFNQGGVCWINVTIPPGTTAVSRSYFRGTGKGAKILAEVLIIILEEFIVSEIDSNLKILAADPLVTGLNPAAVAWLSQNRASAAIVADVATHADPKDSLCKQLQQDFLVALNSQDPRPTAAEFMNSYHAKGKALEYLAISLNLGAFTTIRNHFLTYTCPARKEKAMRETLQEFCEKNPLPPSVPSASAVTTRCGFRKLVEAIAKFYVLHLSEKRRTIWFHGAPNCGKSTIIKFLRQIFLAQTMKLLEGKYTIVSPEHEFSTQLLLLDEASFGLFARGNMELAKDFMEGRGYPHRVMGQTPYPDWEGACIFLASNGLPEISDPEDKGHKHNWPAVRVRTSFFEMTESKPDLGSAAFPFNATVFAHAILETVTSADPSPMTQCSQPQSYEEEKHGPRHLANVPDFTDDEPTTLDELLGEFTTKPNPI
jgi:hypothetical protein